MKTVKDILKGHGSEIWSVSPATSAYEALELMAAKDIGGLVVIENQQIVGIFTERDYARKVILKGKASKDTPVSELMTRQVFYVKPENTLNECMALMTSKHVRHLPVFNNDGIKAVISIGDVVKEIISDQEIKIQALEGYITTEYRKTVGEKIEIMVRDKIIEVPKDAIKRLIKEHLERYNLRLGSTPARKGNYNKEELEELIVLWLEIQAHELNDTLSKLSSKARDAFFEALEEEGWLNTGKEGIG